MPKTVFFDLDGTLISHKTNSIPKSTKEAIKLLQTNGHKVVIATGRVPALFYGVDEELGITSYVGANGRVCVDNKTIVYNKFIDKEVLKKFVDYVNERQIDIAFEGINDYVLNSRKTDLPNKFSDVFHLEYPIVHCDFHLNNDVYQVVMFCENCNLEEFQERFPKLNFSVSNQYGVDVNEKGGMKELGVSKLIEYFDIDIKDTVAFGDGYNDIGMLQLCHTGVAMGNAYDEVKEMADFVTDTVDNNGIYNALKKMGLI